MRRSGLGVAASDLDCGTGARSYELRSQGKAGSSGGRRMSEARGRAAPAVCPPAKLTQGGFWDALGGVQAPLRGTLRLPAASIDRRPGELSLPAI